MKTTLVGVTKVEAVNTNRDGTGTLVVVGELAADSWLRQIVWQSLGDNAVGVGRVFALRPGGATYHMLAETTLPAVVGSTQTAAITQVATTVNRWFAAGTKFFAAVSVDLTAESGYQVSLTVGDHRRDFEAA